jgi:hypothetical protein
VNLTADQHALVADEPPYLRAPGAAVAGGRRRRSRRAATVSLAAGATAALAVAGLLALPTHRTGGQQTLLGASPPAATVEAPQGPLQRLVRGQADPSWTFAVHEDTTTAFDADVDDGTGAGRMGLWLSPPPGSIQQHPCSDAEFAERARCVETDLDADTRLVVKGPGPSGSVTVLTVVLVHRDGSGVVAESDNATWPWPRDGVLTPEEKRALSRPSVNRVLPVWTRDRLVRLVEAADAATSAR